MIQMMNLKMKMIFDCGYQNDIFVIGRIRLNFSKIFPLENDTDFSKRVVIDLLLPLINNELQRTDNRGLPISPILQLLITLRFYATNSFRYILYSFVNMLNIYSIYYLS